MRHLSAAYWLKAHFLAAAALLLLSCSFSAAQERNELTGAKATVAFEDGRATITITNQSRRDITGYAIGITATLTNGALRYSERIKDYGPPLLGLTPLLAGKSADEVDQFPPSVTRVDAKVIVAIYDDQTAEATKEDTFRQILTTRQRIASALQVSARIFKEASLDPAPRERASAAFTNSIADIKSGKLTADEAFLASDAAEAGKAPIGGEASFMADEAKLHERQAAAYGPYTLVRRRP
jgi:hypothetical protein